MSFNKSLVQQYLSFTRKWLWLVLLGALLAGSAALVVSLSLTPIYEASATLFITSSDRPSLSAPTLANVRANQELAATYAELLKKPVTLKAAAERLDLPKIHRGDISAESILDTQLIELRARDPNPQRATDIANTLLVVFQERIKSLQIGRFAESKESLSKELNRLQTEIDVTQASIKAIGEPTTTAAEVELDRLRTVLAQHRSSYTKVLSNYEATCLAEAQVIGNVIVYEEATVPQKPVLPRTWQNTLLAAAVGTALAIGIAFLIEYLDDTLKSPEDVTRALGLSILGSVGHIRVDRRGSSADQLITAATPRSSTSEAFRTLRTNIQFSSVDKPLRRLLVTSPSPTEGKSVTAANLAIVMAQAGQSVVLVDSDLRRPTAHTLFKLSNEVGVTNSLLASSNPDIDGHLLPTAVENLQLLASGPLPPNPSELLGSQRMGQLIECLEQQANIVIFDSPPILAVTDAAVLSRQMDGVLLIIEAGSTREGDAHRAIAELSKVGAPVLGAVLNKVPTRRGHGYDSYYHSESDK
jgi:non-specific protein-tyrosine kinase